MNHSRTAAPSDLDETLEVPSEVSLPVFHGTRQSAAIAISASGFDSVPVDDQIAAVAATYGVSLDGLTADLKARGRYTALDPRNGTVSLAPDFDRAARYANLAPEATWEALRSVYKIQRPHLDFWEGSHEMDFWVLAQQLSDRPVVIEVLAQSKDLHAVSGTGTAASMLLEYAQRGDYEGFVDLYVRTPEWRSTPACLTFAGVRDVPIQLDIALVGYMSGEEPDAFTDQVEQGRWGEPAGQNQLGRPWFSFQEVWTLIAPSRRSELEVIAEVDLQLGE